MKWKWLLRAAKLARFAHRNEKRKHGAPYFTHPKAVVRILWNSGEQDLQTLQAAYLHDVLENTTLKVQYIDETFGEIVTKIVTSLTKNRRESLAKYYQRIKDCGQAAIRIKLADRIHNHSEIALVTNTHVKHVLTKNHEIKQKLMESIFKS